MIEQIITICLNPAIDRVVQTPGLHLGAHTAGQRLLRQPAGKAINVSRALSRLGHDSLVLGFLGQNDLAWFHQELHASAPGKIQTLFHPIAADTRENITLIDPVSQTDTHIREPGFTVSAADIAWVREQILQRARPGVWFIFTGSLPQGLDSAQAWDLLEIASSRGASLAIDTTGEILRLSLQTPLPGIQLIKPNKEEYLQALSLPAHTSIPDLLAHARQHAPGPVHLMLSLGAQGAALLHRGSLTQACLPLAADSIRDTVGCGDALLAGVLTGFLQSDFSPRTLLSRGLATAAANALTPGAANFPPQLPQALVAHIVWS